MVADLISLLNHDGDISWILLSFGCPSSYNDWRCRYLDGRHNIKKFLPSCKVVPLSKHAVVDPRWAIEEMLFFEHVDSLFASSTRNINNSSDYDRRLETLSKERECFVIPICFFSDGYNTSNTGGLRDRSSSWSMFIAIIINGTNCFDIKRMLAIGPGHISHDEVFNYMLPKIGELLCKKRIVYVGNIGKQVEVSFDLKFFSADLPEREDILHVLSYSSPLHSFFGVIIPNLKDDEQSWIQANLHSCRQCLSRRISTFVDCYINSLPECKHFSLILDTYLCCECADFNPSKNHWHSMNFKMSQIG